MRHLSSFSIKNTWKLLLLLFLFIGVSETLFASVFYQDMQQESSYNQYEGKVLDSKTKNPLTLTTISLSDNNISTISNNEGRFLLKIPKSITNGSVVFSFVGYKSKTILLSDLKEKGHVVFLEVSVTQLDEVDILAPKDATALVKETFAKKGKNYFNDPILMTAFYRETIKKRKTNVSLSEAVVNIYKTPYTSQKNDAIELYKARKSTDYKKLDTISLKLQGGPFNTLFVDIMKYPEYIFTEETIPQYTFRINHNTQINNRNIYVVHFAPISQSKSLQYTGKLYIDVKNKTLTSAIFSLNTEDKEKTSRAFVKRKPSKADVWPTEVAYRVDYREKNGKWYYSYSNVLLEFKIDYDKKLFNSKYTMNCEMAVTDWRKNTGETLKAKERLKSSVVLSDEAFGFANPDFWGENNIIEPEKSIESAIKKIQRKLKNSPNGKS